MAFAICLHGQPLCAGRAPAAGLLQVPMLPSTCCQTFPRGLSPRPRGQRGPFSSGWEAARKGFGCCSVSEPLGVGGKVFNEARTVRVCTPSQSPAPGSLAMQCYTEATYKFTCNDFHLKAGVWCLFTYKWFIYYWSVTFQMRSLPPRAAVSWYLACPTHLESDSRGREKGFSRACG